MLTPALQRECAPSKRTDTRPDASSQQRTTTTPTPALLDATEVLRYNVSARLQGPQTQDSVSPMYINAAIYLEDTQ